MEPSPPADRRTTLEQLCALLDETDYTDAIRAQILQLLTALGIDKSDDGEYAALRQVRGRLVSRPRAGGVEIAATGRGDWVGWVELKTDVDRRARETRN